MSTQKEIVNLLNTFKIYCNTADSQMVSELFTYQAILLPHGKSAIKSQLEIRSYYQQSFAEQQYYIKFHFNEEDIVLHEDIAFVHTRSSGSKFIRKTGQSVQVANRELWIFQKNPSLKICRYMFNELSSNKL